MKTHAWKYYFSGLLLLFTCYLQAQVPARPNPPRLVNDFAHVWTAAQQMELEQRLTAFNDSTSNQIVLVTVSSLNGYDRAQFAYETGEKWGVGQEKFDNGVVILVKPKSGNERGEAFIAPGYGLEGALPDAICRRIVDDYMIPHFRENDYYGGIVAGLDIVLPLANGEYSEALESNNGGFVGKSLVVLILFMLILLIILGKNGPRNLSSGNRGGDFWTGMMIGGMLGGSGRSHGGSWGGFSSGGGFGGFGGGSFGGGGAGGSW